MIGKSDSEKPRGMMGNVWLSDIVELWFGSITEPHQYFRQFTSLLWASVIFSIKLRCFTGPVLLKFHAQIEHLKILLNKIWVLIQQSGAGAESLYITSSQVASTLQICGSYFWVAKDQLMPQGLWFYWAFESWNYEITDPTPAISSKTLWNSSDFQATLKFQNPSSEHIWICGLEFFTSMGPKICVQWETTFGFDSRQLN